MKARLSMAFEDLRGKDGNVVITKTRVGLVLTPRRTSHNPATTPQQTARTNFTKATTAFKALTSTQFANWKAYAHNIDHTEPITGVTYNPTAISVFVGLASKFLQVNPTGTIPTAPPANPFGGDSITVTATAGTGVITFTASGANATNVKTEVLVQPLRSNKCTPFAKAYRSKGFYLFWSGGLVATVSVPSGAYAAAYRFVNTLTGQQSDLIPIAVVSVALSLSQDEPTHPCKPNRKAA